MGFISEWHRRSLVYRALVAEHRNLRESHRALLDQWSSDSARLEAEVSELKTQFHTTVKQLTDKSNLLVSQVATLSQENEKLEASLASYREHVVHQQLESIMGVPLEKGPDGTLVPKTEQKTRKPRAKKTPDEAPKKTKKQPKQGKKRGR